MNVNKAKQFIFPITTGRTGTTFVSHLLERNLPDHAEIYHERASFLGSRFHGFGIDTPDASHFTRFNTIGNDPWVQTFWAQKNARLINSETSIYAEISHPLVKAGLIENIDPLAKAGRVDLIILNRDIEKVMWSFVNRMVFNNYGFTWLFAIDPRSPNVIVDYGRFRKEGIGGMTAWYIHEMRTRAEYYRLLLDGRPNIHIHEFDLSELVKPEGASRFLKALGHDVDEPVMPERANANTMELLGKRERQHCRFILQTIKVDHKARARAFFDSGHRLGAIKPDTGIVP